jgi:hypothetical protein
MSRVSKKQSNSDVQIRSEADRGTEQVRTQTQRPRRNSIGSPKLTGRYKDLLSSSTHNTPMLKRVHFDKPTTIE